MIISTMRNLCLFPTSIFIANVAYYSKADAAALAGHLGIDLTTCSLHHHFILIYTAHVI